MMRKNIVLLFWWVLFVVVSGISAQRAAALPTNVSCQNLSVTRTWADWLGVNYGQSSGQFTATNLLFQNINLPTQYPWYEATLSGANWNWTNTLTATDPKTKALAYKRVEAKDSNYTAKAAFYFYGSATGWYKYVQVQFHVTVKETNAAGAVTSTTKETRKYDINLGEVAADVLPSDLSGTVVYNSTKETFKTVGVLTVPPSKVTISSVYIDTQGVPQGSLHADNTMEFAGGNDSKDGQIGWGSSDPDLITCSAAIVNGSSALVNWKVEPGAGAGTATLTVQKGAATSFRLKNLPAIADTQPRPALSFKVTAILLNDKGVEVSRDTKTVTQGQIGQLRQIYVDHPVTPRDPVYQDFETKKVPDVAHFSNITAVPWNDTGIFKTGSNPQAWYYPNIKKDWMILGPFAKKWGDVDGSSPVIQFAALFGMTTRVNSVYRDPLSHWRYYRRVLQSQPTVSSRHLWGNAIDFKVRADFCQPSDVLDIYDYGMLAQMCKSMMLLPDGVSSEGYVHYEGLGAISHVHLQPVVGRDLPPECDMAESLKLTQNGVAVGTSINLKVGQSIVLRAAALSHSGKPAAVFAAPGHSWVWTVSQPAYVGRSNRVLKGANACEITLTGVAVGTSQVTVNVPDFNFPKSVTVNVVKAASAANSGNASSENSS